MALAIAPAHAEDALVDYAGSYRASARETRVEITTWGEDCGPRPQNATEATSGNVQVTMQAAQLVLGFPDRALRTDRCWSPNPAVRVTSSVATTARWRTECRTPDSDAKREHGVYTLTATSRETLELLEESAYDWQLKSSHCIAKVRVTQKLARGAAPLVEPKTEPEAASTSCTPGPLARLRLRPTEALIGPDERVCFTVRGTDAVGCAVPLTNAELKWSLVKPEAATGTLASNCFRAATRAAEAEGRFQVVVARGSIRTEAAVSVVPQDLSDITARRGTRRGGGASEDEEDGGITAVLGIDAVVSSSVGVRVALAAALLALLAGLGWLLHLRARRRAARRRRATPSRPAKPSRAAPSISGADEQLICPQCRQGYPGGTERCARDGARPIPYAEFVRQAQAAESGALTCPACGAQLAAGALFCGTCGAKVRSG